MRENKWDSSNSCVAIVDYSRSNILSVVSACEAVGLKVRLVSRESEIHDAAGLVLPGVGSFSSGIDRIGELGIQHAILDFIASERPVLAICLGFQLLFDSSEESPGSRGLGVFPGVVKRLRPSQSGGMRVPNIGWRKVSHIGNDSSVWPAEVFGGNDGGAHFYFVHSYYAAPSDPSICSSVAKFDNFEYCASVTDKSIFACQFHPEKSGKRGLLVFKNFARSIEQAFLRASPS